MNPRWIAAGGAAVLLIGGGLVIGRATRDASSPQAAAPTGSAAPSVPVATTPASPASPASGEPLPEPERATTVDARGRSVEVSSVTAAGLRDVRLRGSTVELSVTGRVADGDGRDLGEGTLLASGSAVDIAGGEIELGPVSLRLGSSDALLLDDHPSIEARTRVAVRAATLELRTSNGRTTQLSGNLASVTGSHLFARLGGTSLRWRNPPASIGLSGRGRIEVSWSDRGTVRVPGVKTFSMQRGGVVFSSVRGTLRRGSPVTVSAAGDVLQVYADGVPQLRTNGTVEIVTPVVRVGRGERGWLTWAPRNLGEHDMCILKIRPLNAAGRWVNLALDEMPKMSGGASQPPVGGDTRGLRKGGFFGGAAPIDAVIRPGTADRESISFDVPADAKPGTYHILLALDGTFPTIRADIEVRVS